MQDYKALLISKYCLGKRPLDSPYDFTWKTCSLRGYLNSNFIDDAFTSEEQTAIVTTRITIDMGNGNHDSTLDNVFILNEAEIKKYCNDKRIVGYFQPFEGTTYANKQNGYSCCWVRPDDQRKRYSGYGSGPSSCPVVYGYTKSLSFSSLNAYSESFFRPVLYIDLNIINDLIYTSITEEPVFKEKKTNSSSMSTYFTNKYGTPTTKCAHPGCNNYIASSGDTNCCTTHSKKCLTCGKYIDEDAVYCMDCLEKALRK